MSRIPDIDEYLNSYRGQEWELGNDTDCETCGMSWNRAQFDPDFSGENEWSFHYSVGCYNGASLYWYDEDREEKLKEMFDDLNTFPGWPGDGEKIIRKMIEECDRLREQK